LPTNNFNDNDRRFTFSTSTNSKPSIAPPTNGFNNFNSNSISGTNDWTDGKTFDFNIPSYSFNNNPVVEGNDADIVL
jgi:hypothetical protein